MHSNLNRKDYYVLAIIIATSLILWDTIQAVTLGSVFAMLGSTNMLVYIPTTLLLVVITFLIFNIFSAALKYVHCILSNSSETEEINTGKKLGSLTPQLLALIALYIILLVVQSLWYILSGY